MFKKFLKVFLFILFISLSRYVGMYLSISYSNKMLLNIMSKYNPLINAKPMLSILPFFGEIAPYGRTPLIYAISSGDFETIEVLLNNGADVNVTSLFNAKPLEWCLKHGGKNRYKIAKLLIENGANSFADNDFIIKLLISTKLDDDDETLRCKNELFIEWMGKHYLYDKDLNYLMIYYAVCGNSIDEFLYLMNNYDIDVNYKDNDGWYILEPAAENRNVEFFKLLIDYGANIDFIDENGMGIEDYILDEKFDKKNLNNEYKLIDYNKEKEEMLKIINKIRNRE